MKSAPNLNSSNEETEKKARKNKEEKLKQIDEQKIDDGRGGNCVAANLSKTLIRIIEMNIRLNFFRAGVCFRSLLKKYKIHSQKENVFILMLILHMFVKHNKLSNEIY
jgi:hypothetical protein